MSDGGGNELVELGARARALLTEQRPEEAEALYRDFLHRAPAPEHHSVLAEALLMQGDFRNGFREYESRWSRRQLIERGIGKPEWDGSLVGRSILVLGEQGIGDEIQLARFVPKLKELGARHVTVCCRPENLRAFEQLGADAVADRFGVSLSVPRDACWVKMWSLPHRLGLRAGDLDGRAYLAARPLGPGGIGLVERGQPNNPRDQDRSMPAGLLQAAVPGGRLLAPTGDVLDSLSRVAALDLLITVDTSWAHMAGALGVPCWVLLPYRNLDWRWMRERSDSPWYASLRLFRQPSPGDWASVLAQVSEALAAGGFG